jgi:hypothetical protein
MAVSKANIRPCGKPQGTVASRRQNRRPQENKTREITKMRRGLYTSNYTGIPAYLMDFGFGGFLGYGRSLSSCVGKKS